ncbi:MAG: pilus assembly protein [Myxococcota bacterium]
MRVHALRPLLAILTLVFGFADHARGDAGDLDLLSTAVAPNVMILFDNSGSMNHHLWDDDFDPTTLYPAHGYLWCPPTIPGSSCPNTAGINPAAMCPNNPSGTGSSWDVSRIVPGQCPNNEGAYGFGGSSSFNFSISGTTRTIYTDTSVPQSTRYSANYLNWLYGQSTSAERANEPTQTRLQAAKSMITQVIDQVDPDDGMGGYTENVRFGLSRFDSKNFDGGFVNVPISSGNKNNVKSGISSIQGNTWTPLSETLVDIGRYFAGSNKLGSYDKYDRNTKDGKKTSNPPSSPVDLFCRKNFVIIITDGEPTKDKNDHHGSDFMKTIGNGDLDCNESAAVGTCSQSTNDDPKTGRDDGLAYTSDGTDWLDDVAYYLFNTDLDPNLQGTQNVITYTIGFTIDHPLLRNTATNGDGTYFTTDAANVGLLAQQLSDALLDIINRSTSFTAASVPASRTSFGDGLYTAYFQPGGSDGFWEGHLEAYRLDNNGNILDRFNNPAIDPNTGLFVTPRLPIWDAATQVKAQFTGRKLYTSIAGARVDFNEASLMTALGSADPNSVATLLGLDPADPNTAAAIPAYPNFPASGVSTPVGLSRAIINFMYGMDSFDQNGDGINTDPRVEALGDVFHSTPTMVGPVTSFLFAEEGFGSSTTSDPPFFTQYEHRDRVLYAGSNDGMLHGFDSGQFATGDNPNTPWVVEPEHFTMGTGNELFGYVPELLQKTVQYIPRNKPRTHFYVDATPSVADAWLGNPSDPNDITKTPDEWATVEVVGLREGGRGYLALDVTNPAAALATDPHGPYPKLLWEIGPSTLPDLANSWSRPILTRVKVRAPSGTGDNCGKSDGDGDCREEWVAIFGGGFDETGNPNSASYTSGGRLGRAIYMVELDTGNLLASVVYDPTGVTGPSNMQYAIPSSPAVLDLDFDGFADVVYVGDLGGQLWKWDIKAVGSDTTGGPQIDNWSAGTIFVAPPQGLGGGVTHYKSIFFPPSATFASGKLLLVFATGERTDLRYPGDPSKDENNRFYSLRDANPTGISAFTKVYGESDLTDITGLDKDPDLTDDGFYFVLSDSEKFITNTTIFAGFAITASYTPDLSGGNVCDSTGTSRLYIFDVASGLGFYFNAGVTVGDSARRVSIGSGAPTDPRITISHQGNQLYIQTSNGRLVKTAPPPPSTAPVQTIYWRQNF